MSFNISCVYDDERIFHSVKTGVPSLWKPETGRPSTGLLKNPKGCSVDRDGDRENPEIIDSFIQRFGQNNVLALIWLIVLECRQEGARVVPEPIIDPSPNPYHALLLGAGKKQLESGKLKVLTNAAKIIMLNVIAN